MTIQEAKQILIGRIGFQGDEPISGRFYESEHPIISLENIKVSQPEIDITDEDFTLYISNLKSSVCFQVLSDVVIKNGVNDNLFDLYPSLFDNLLAMQMQIKVYNILLSSTRSSRNEAINKNSLQRIYFDLKGNKGSEKYPIADGIEHKYRSEVRRVKNRVGGQRKFTNVTMR